MQEIFYVLDGGLVLRLDERTFELGPGGFALVSPGTLHAFSNPAAERGEFLLICSPGGLEGYFEELPGIVARHGYPPPPEVMRGLGEKYDTFIPG
jgi:glyoxylate utilization-related uncharacterized protein